MPTSKMVNQIYQTDVTQKFTVNKYGAIQTESRRLSPCEKFGVNSLDSTQN